MRKNRILAAATAAALAVCLLAGCGSAASSTETAASSETPASEAASSEAAVSEAASSEAEPAATTAEGDVKTGFAILTSVSSSKAAAADANGVAKSNITMAAVTLDENGVILDCVIDMQQTSVEFDTTGAIVGDLDAELRTKDELGEDYGMKGVSGIGKEWNEQAEALAAYCVGKTGEQVAAIALDDSGKATDPDLLSGATVGISGYIKAVAQAVQNAEYRGAKAGDTLKLVSTTSLSNSKNAAADADGQVQAYLNGAAVTLDGDVVTSCYIDAVQATVKFDTTGALTSDVESAVDSKNVLGDDYGMRKASGIGKEWNEQAEAFGEYVVGKSAAEVAGLAADDADLLSGCTIGVSAFQTLIAKAAQ
jgi:hypothetical protein